MGVCGKSLYNNPIINRPIKGVVPVDWVYIKVIYSICRLQFFIIEFIFSKLLMNLKFLLKLY